MPRFRKGWDHTDAPLLWIETIYNGDNNKMAEFCGFRYSGHFYVSYGQKSTFYINIQREKEAKAWGKKRYSDPGFVDKLYREMGKVGDRLDKVSRSFSGLKNKSDRQLLKLFEMFFKSYSDCMGLYRFSRGEFYEHIAKKDALKSMEKIGHARFEGHKLWVDSFHRAQKLFNEIGKRRGLSGLEVQNCTSEEIRVLLKTGKKPKDISERVKSFKFIDMGNAYKIDHGLISQRSKVMKKWVRGRCAYPGRITGEVYKVEESLRKVSFGLGGKANGKILVTVMTDPNMLPLMEKAAAFVTDEGGVLCHAAIVAREMKKPCVIGTQDATLVLNTGDWVEVDATKGIVKLLSKRSSHQNSTGRSKARSARKSPHL